MIDDQALHSAASCLSSQVEAVRAGAGVAAVDHDDRSADKTRLGRGVQDHRMDDVRQRLPRKADGGADKYGLHSRSGNVEIDRRMRVCVDIGFIDGPAQASITSII